MKIIERLILECSSLIKNKNDKGTEIFIGDMNKIITESSFKKKYYQRFLEIVNMKNEVSVPKLNVDRVGVACTNSRPTGSLIPEYIETIKKVDAPNHNKLRELLILLQEIKKDLEIDEFIEEHN